MLSGAAPPEAGLRRGRRSLRCCRLARSPRDTRGPGCVGRPRNIPGSRRKIGVFIKFRIAHRANQPLSFQLRNPRCYFFIIGAVLLLGAPKLRSNKVGLGAVQRGPGCPRCLGRSSGESCPGPYSPSEAFLALPRSVTWCPGTWRGAGAGCRLPPRRGAGRR